MRHLTQFRWARCDSFPSDTSQRLPSGSPVMRHPWSCIVGQREADGTRLQPPRSHRNAHASSVPRCECAQSSDSARDQTGFPPWKPTPASSQVRQLSQKCSNTAGVNIRDDVVEGWSLWQYKKKERNGDVIFTAGDISHFTASSKASFDLINREYWEDKDASVWKAGYLYSI